MDRRDLNLGLVLSGLINTLPIAIGAEFARAGDDPIPPTSTNSGRPFHIGMIVYDGMTLLDFAGPADVWSRPPMAKVFVLGTSREPVITDTRSRVVPDLALADAPELDLLFVGGGIGVSRAMEAEKLIEFLQVRAPAAKWITSVCTGALILGAAGLLRGYKAATHWASMDLLPILGAEPVEQRVVIDRNRITGGGVTAGIDFGLTVASQLWGVEMAQLLQLGTEYNPRPPYNAGSPRTAPPELVERFKKITAKSAGENKAAALRAASMFN